MQRGLRRGSSPQFHFHVAARPKLGAFATPPNCCASATKHCGRGGGRQDPCKKLSICIQSRSKSKTRLGKACLTQASFKVVGMASRSLFAGGLTPSEAATAPAPGTAAPAAALCAASSATKTLSRACLWSCVSRYACSLHIYKCMKEDRHQ